MQSFNPPYPCTQSLDERILLAEVVEKVVGDLADGGWQIIIMTW